MPRRRPISPAAADARDRIFWTKAALLLAALAITFTFVPGAFGQAITPATWVTLAKLSGGYYTWCGRRPIECAPDIQRELTRREIKLFWPPPPNPRRTAPQVVEVLGLGALR